MNEERFIEALKAATKTISAQYFALPIADSDSAVNRERVYCYELYHQLRLEIGDEGQMLAGEVDKMCHLVIHKKCGPKKPDLIVHVPGQMTDNFAVIEVKPVDRMRDSRGWKKDLDTLECFVRHAKYTFSVFLLYGADLPPIERVSAEIAKRQPWPLKVFWHRQPREAAELLNFPPIHEIG